MQYFYWLKRCLILELLSVDLSYTYKCMFYVSANSNVLYIPPRLSAFSHSIDICTIAIKNVRNMHPVSTNQIADILNFNDNV